MVFWLAGIAVLAAVHCIHLTADFPNHSPWMDDWAKYTDEGWYGNAAIRAHLFGNWYVPGDFNPAPAVPVWPFLEWLLFFVTGVSITAARALSVSFFVLDLVLGYLLLRTRSPRWIGLLAVTMAAANPLLYAFSRLAILEPMLLALMLAALNLAVRLDRWKRPMVVSAAIGLLYTVLLLTKTSAAFLLPALAWAILASRPLRQTWRYALAAGATSAVTFAAWMALVVRAGLLADYRYLFFINKYVKPTEFYWPLLSLWWSLKGAMWGGRALMLLAGAVAIGAFAAWRTEWSRRLRSDAVFMPVLLSGLGYILFMTYQNHPQPRYYVVVTFFAILLVMLGVRATGFSAGPGQRGSLAAVAGVLIVIGMDAGRTITYAAHPEYTWVQAAHDLTRYIDEHPNGNRILLSISGDEITLMTHLPSLCDDFGTQQLPDKLARYKPGWWATWNDIDPGTLEDIHVHYSLEQVAKFEALDHPERDTLVLFKLHQLAPGVVHEAGKPALQEPMPGDRIHIPVQ
jgi:4-amino-4-deoxy-L-arabinose transferase-like glycosyltransferase